MRMKCEKTMSKYISNTKIHNLKWLAALVLTCYFNLVSAQKAIIDKIIEVTPTNIRLDPNQRFFAADSKAKESLIESEDLVTETLAKIYALQGNISKAIRAYEILSLKFPQKSAYFATLIQNLKETKPNK